MRIALVERSQDHQELAERLAAQREQRLVDAARLRRVVRDRGVDHQDAGQREDHAPGHGSDRAEPADDAPCPAAHLRRPQVLRELAPDAFDREYHADDDDDQADEADQPPAGGMLHGRGGDVLLPLGLATAATGDDLERQVGEAGIDQGPAQRPQPGTRAVRVAGDAERGLACAPERVAGEADAQQPERDQAVRLARE
jgi:hypothetical protein